MTSTTDPTVPLPTATDTDDDDDDDDASSSLLSSQPPAATPPPTQPATSAPAPAPSAETSIPGSPSLAPAPTTAPNPTPSNPSEAGQISVSNTGRPSLATELADRLPSGSPTALSPAGSTNESNSGGRGLGTGASAGVGIGVALIVCLAAFGVWFFLRRRKARRNKTRSAFSHSSDEEHAQKPSKAEVYAHRAGGPVEVSGDEKPQRWSELESPTYVAEVSDGQVFRAELPGSAVPVATAHKKGDERLFADAPIDEVDEPDDAQGGPVDEKNERLFSDPPLDECIDTLKAKPSRLMEKKGHL
ncbi:hypothetical protein E8E12_000980 [Didymella heteroderae]|uniref:Uncharacterized protein n=1 Tax=Didymella heteroderae TaxID=1769908 RepID=A0A9P4WLP4_9PLEO|nr:hypothetical protein E8E12_000980 [Didymella heteroderae]